MHGIVDLRHGRTARQDHMSRPEVTNAHLYPEPLDHVLSLMETSCVDEVKRHVRVINRRLESISRRTRKLRNDRALLPNQCIEQR